MSNTYANLFPYAKPPLGPAVAPIQGPLANISFPTGAYSSLKGGATYIPSTQFAGGMFNPYGTAWDAKQFLKGSPTSARLGAVSLTGPGANIEKLRYALLDPTQRASQLSKLGIFTNNAKTAIGASPRLAGAMALGGKALPWLPVAGNVLEGDLAGAGLSAGGALAGGAIGGILLPGVGAPIGATIGGMLGEPVGKGVVKLAGGLMGIDPNNPLSGPDISIFGKPLSPYAKTKKQQKRAIELAELRMPLYNKIMDKQLAREMQMQQADNISQSIRNVYSTNPYIR